MWASKTLVAVVFAATLAAAVGQVLSAQKSPTLASDAACKTLTPVSVGGPAPTNPNVVAIRWLGHTNYEIAYRSEVVLTDGWYDRGPGTHAIGVAPKDFKRADAILVGHAHFDHIADVPQIAKQTKALVVGAPVSTDYVKTQAIPDNQIRTVTGKGGEIIEMKGIVVKPMLAHHNIIATMVPEGYLQKAQAAMAKASLDKPPTPDEQKQIDMMREHGSRDPKIADEGTMGFLLSVGSSNFRIMVVDSPGPITDYERQAMQGVPGVDVAMFSLVNMEAGMPPLLDLVKFFKPSTVFIGHHDGAGTMHWASIFPAAMAIRDALPKTRTLEVPYRTPVCFDTTTKEMFVGQ